ncbi:MAG: UDP-N-acetylglucosamine 1-carboxyvinyltransferase [Candidatus Hydrogenedentes bacterium]|nr:UDP-N-acetylglucosamine 1-carboxyvinyltransferase [Candidatus Hydrogenedentota bacterium]
MDKILIRGGKPLKGDVQVRGAKNAALPLMAAALLAEGPCVLHNVPCLHDVFTMDKILSSMGVDIEFTGRYMTLTAPSTAQPEAPYDLVRKMRASFFVLGPLLGRFGRARVSLPGGCAIGTRPVDIHLKGLEALGANIRIDEGYVLAEGRLTGADITLAFPSVGATENIMMAACRAQGVTRLSNAAREPEIEDLARFLNGMGARISGAGTDLITVVGVEALSGVEHAVIADRIEAGTFLTAGAATGGEVTVSNACPEHLVAFLDKLREAGADVEVYGRRIRIAAPNGLKAVDVATQPYPGFATDLQAQMMALLTCAAGVSHIKETVFENRFMQASELVRMGADIALEGNMAIVRGVQHLSGAPVMASDLRASAALVIAGLMATRGETAIARVYHIDRGYERIEERLATLGADVERVHE